MGCRVEEQNWPQTAVPPRTSKRAFSIPKCAPGRSAPQRCGPSAFQSVPRSMCPDLLSLREN